MACAGFGGRRKSAFFLFRRTVYSLCRVVLAWGHRRKSAFFLFRRTMIACADFGVRRKPAFFSFRRTMHSLCRVVLAWGHRRKSAFFLFRRTMIACADFGVRRKPAFFSFRRTMHSLCRLRRPTKANFLLISSDCAWLVPLDGYSRRRHTVRITIKHPSNDQTGQPHLSNVTAPYNIINLSSLHFHPESLSSQALPRHR